MGNQNHPGPLRSILYGVGAFLACAVLSGGLYLLLQTDGSADSDPQVVEASSPANETGIDDHPHRHEEGDSDETEVPAQFKMMPFYATGPVAKVDGVDVSADAFNAETSRLVRMIPELPAFEAEVYKTRVLDNTIGDAILSRAADSAKISVSPADIDQSFSEMKAGIEAQSRGGMQEFYRKNGLDEASVREEIAHALRLKTFVRKHTKLPDSATDKALQSATQAVLEELKPAADIQKMEANIKINPDPPHFHNHAH